jgi:Cys-tRNA(Pro)/Cys-tRNA(Cys) deacylase
VPVVWQIRAVAGRETPATRAAKAAGIDVRVHEYEHDPRTDSYGTEAAEKLGLDPARVLKTLLADVDGTLTVCVLPIGKRLDLGALGKRAQLADP